MLTASTNPTGQRQTHDCSTPERVRPAVPGDADSLSLAGFLDADDEQWHRLFDLNLFSAVWTTRAALPSCSPGVASS